MRSKHLAPSSLAVLALGAMTLGAQATPLNQSSPYRLENPTLAQTVDYRSYCSRWRDICINRWGYRTWRYRRCLSVHGCL